MAANAVLTFVDESGLTPAEIIEVRARIHKEDKLRKSKIYRLRLIVANHLQGAGYGESNFTAPTDYPDQEIDKWEEARHNPLTVNTLIQAKSLAFEMPELEYRKIDYVYSAVRRAYYEAEYDRLELGQLYQQNVLDLLVTGEASAVSGVRDNLCYQDWADILSVTFDKAYKEGAQKRFVLYDLRLPLMELLTYFPECEKLTNYQPRYYRNVENPEVITCYHDKTTSAYLYKGKIVRGPVATKTPGRLPLSYTYFMRKPSIISPSGVAEEQLGNLRLVFRLQRSLREKALRAGTLVGLFSGPVLGEEAENMKSQIRDGKECVIVTVPPGGDFNWRSPQTITDTEIQAYERAIQSMSSESGVDEFQRAQTDTKVDFAARLQLIAQKAGVQGDYAASRSEACIKNNISLLMETASVFEKRSMVLDIDEAQVEFDELRPVAPLLGTDGQLVLKKSGAYEGIDAKLNETALLATILQEALTLPEPLQLRFLGLGLEAAQIDNRKEWLDEYESFLVEQQQVQVEQAQQQMAASSPTGADGGQGYPSTGNAPAY